MGARSCCEQQRRAIPEKTVLGYDENQYGSPEHFGGAASTMEFSAREATASAGVGSRSLPARGNLAVSFGGNASLIETGEWQDAHQIESKFHKRYDMNRETQQPLGIGATATVWVATDKSTQETFAVKNVRRRDLKKGTSVASEVILMERLDHPNIIKVINSFEETKESYVVLEHCAGGDLLECILDEFPFSEAAAVVSINQMLRAVGYLHAKRIIHRDCKAENWLLATPERLKKATLKLCDFGIAKRVDIGELACTRVGTPYYVAPEIAKGKHYDEKVDMWCLGIVLHMIFSGNPPYTGQTEDVLKKIRNPKEVSMNSIKNVASDEARKLLEGMLDKDPSTRMSAQAALQHRALAHPVL